MAGRDVIMLEKISQGGAWYEGQVYDIGARVEIVDGAAQAEAGAAAGRVVGYDPSGPRPGEDFTRVLVQPDTPTPTIIALPPVTVAPEEGSERAGLARSVLSGLEQSLRPEQFTALLGWLAGPECAVLIADPAIRRQRVRLGGIYLPGLILPERAALARERSR